VHLLVQIIQAGTLIYICKLFIYNATRFGSTATIRYHTNVTGKSQDIKLYLKRSPRDMRKPAQRRGASIVPANSQPGTRRTWVVNTTFRPFYLQDRDLVPKYRRLGGPRGRFERHEISRLYRHSIRGPSSSQSLYRRAKYFIVAIARFRTFSPDCHSNTKIRA
jgi:hypothetical protein